MRANYGDFNKIYSYNDYKKNKKFNKRIYHLRKSIIFLKTKRTNKKSNITKLMVCNFYYSKYK